MCFQEAYRKLHNANNERKNNNNADTAEKHSEQCTKFNITMKVMFKKYKEFNPDSDISEEDFCSYLYTFILSFDIKTKSFRLTNGYEQPPGEEGEEQCSNQCTFRCVTCERCWCACQCILLHSEGSKRPYIDWTRQSIYKFLLDN
jgi:hypothetical protein